MELEEDEDEEDDVDVLVDDEVVEVVGLELVAKYAPAAAIISTTMITTAIITLLIPTLREDPRCNVDFRQKRSV